jgi:isoleucyl-tRNA synthetase
MKAKLAQREPEILKYWREIDLYEQLRVIRKESETFVIHDGPPFANGAPHLGHALNRILKDCIVKFKTLGGYDAPFVPGWDCHGLPIEIIIEKKIGKPGAKLSQRAFRKACRDYARSQVEIQKAVFERLGTLADWKHPYLTMDYRYEANIVRNVARIIENGHLVRGLKPVYWCMDCQSALAEFEVEYRDKPSVAIDVKFAVVDPHALFSRFTADKTVETFYSVNVPIWTTTPWTLPANQAVALNPNLKYVLIECHTEHGMEVFVVADALVEATMKRYEFDKFNVLAECLGKTLDGLLLQHPFYERQVPIVLADHVTVESGTGAVHTAPGHGQDDYVVGQRYGLKIDNPVDERGCFLPDTPLVGGESIYQANTQLVEILREEHKLLHAETIQHSYPHCWRHKKPVIFRATPQWFISMDKAHLRETALKALEETTWFPDFGKTRIADMIKKRPDWCISRQRSWFVPLPLFVHRITDELHPRTSELLETIAGRIEKEGIEIWDEIEPSELLGDEAKDYVKISDALDVWMDSGLSHACVLEDREELRFPADVYLEGTDQYRGWFQSSLLTACAIQGKAPYRQVIVNGFTVDEKGHKMSKSLGNIISPMDIVNQLGAEILRLFVVSTDYHSEIAFSKTILEHVSDIYRRIRNTARFLLSNLYDFDPLLDRVLPKEMLALDRWVVDRSERLQKEILAGYESYQFNGVVQKIHHFCNVDLGSFYLDIIKDRLYTTKKTSLPRRSSQTAMYHILQALVRWIAPMLSFTAEEIWQHMPNDDAREASVFLSTWYEELFLLSEDDEWSHKDWNRLIAVREALNKQIESLRQAGQLGSALEADVMIYANPAWYEVLSRLGDELRFLFITSAVKIKPLSEAGATAVASEIDGLKFVIVKSKFPKCERCWHRCEDVGQNEKHPTICSRCIENIEGDGERRRFA